MRKFDGAAAAEIIDGIGHRITLRTATGEAVYHDLSEEERSALLEVLGTEAPEPEAPPAEEPAKPAKRRTRS